jgi:hypothetical protein
VSEPTPRQVLYALVAAGTLLVVAVLVVGAAVSGLAPVWWTWLTGATLAVVSVWCVLNWRRTGLVLISAIGLFLAWSIGTLIVAS